MNNFVMLQEQLILSEGLFDIINTLKRAFSNFRYSTTKDGLIISVENYEVDGIYAEIVNKASERGFRQIKTGIENKYEFVGSTGEIFKVSQPRQKSHTTQIVLSFN